MPAWRTCGCCPNLLAKGLGRHCSCMRWNDLASADTQFCDSRQILMQSVFTRRWVCTGQANIAMNWKVSRVACRSWKWDCIDRPDCQSDLLLFHQFFRALDQFL